MSSENGTFAKNIGFLFRTQEEPCWISQNLIQHPAHTLANQKHGPFFVGPAYNLGMWQPAPDPSARANQVPHLSGSQAKETAWCLLMPE